jgi:hypothetical protein
MEHFDNGRLQVSFAFFKWAAAKGHEKSIWICSVLKGVEICIWSGVQDVYSEDTDALKEAFVMTEEPLGWYFAGKLSDERDRFGFYKKSAEGGCSWGQVDYAAFFRNGQFVEKDEKAYVELLEKAAHQNNPRAMYWLGSWFQIEGGDKQKAMLYYRAAAQLGCKSSMHSLAEMLRYGEGCAKDLRHAAMCSAQETEPHVFWEMVNAADGALMSGATEDLDCDLNQLCYSIGWGLYWYQDTGGYRNQWIEYYCRCVELQQKSIFTFLLCWNQTTGGVKGPGQIIGKMVWERREDNLMKTFEEMGGEEPETK